ncbi:hypothetical protein MPSEU_000076000 [Mayamaea pseudoterrestris]|nr:hypothetical protein MPSEU_000076000 [Mayamaea pseudoterrestris]
MPSFLPHGSLTFVALLFAAAAYAFSLFGAFGNKTFKLEFDDTQDNIANDRLGSIDFGYFGYCGINGCQNYKDGDESFIKNYDNAILLTGVSVALIIAVLGGVFLLFLLLTLCIRMTRWIMVTMGLVFGVCLSLPALSLVISGVGFGSPDCFNNFDDDNFLTANFTWNTTTDQFYYCRPAIGSILAFISAVLWIITLSMLCCCMTSDREEQLQPTHDMEQPYVVDAQSVYSQSPSKIGEAQSNSWAQPQYAGTATTGLEEDRKSVGSPR